MGWHTVEQGDCLTSLAALVGAEGASTILDHPQNVEHKQKRPNANVLHPGDRIFLPETGTKKVDVAPGQKHRFQARRARAWVRLHLKDHEGRAHANRRYRLVVDGNTLGGETDGDGLVEQRIPPGAREGKLSLWLSERDAPSMTWTIKLGHLDPIDEISGVQARLENLGFPPGDVDGRLTPATRRALLAFQRKHGLEATGQPDDATRDRLVAQHAGT